MSSNIKIHSHSLQCDYCGAIIRGTFFLIGDAGDPPEVHERVWERRPFHYDDVFDAMCTLFAVQTSEGWVA